MSKITSLADLHKVVLQENQNKKPGERKISGLHIGEISGKLPKVLVDITQKNIQKGELGYTSSFGLENLRDLISLDLNQRKGFQTTSENILLTNGSKQGLFYAINLLVKPGDEVILHRPYWNNYQYLVEHQGGKIVSLDLEKNGNLNLKLLTKLINPKTKLIIICNPHNPTGSIPDRENLEQLETVVKRHQVTVLADEIYEKLDYYQKHLSLGAISSLRDQVITLGGFSKSHQMTGFRIGYLVATPSFITKAAKLQANICTCPSTLSQLVAVDAIQNQNLVETLVNELKDRLVVLKKIFQHYPSWQADGAFYLFVDIRQKLRSDQTDQDICLELLGLGVALAPGSLFGLANYIRISYACEETLFQQSLPILEHYFNDHR